MPQAEARPSARTSSFALFGRIATIDSLEGIRRYGSLGYDTRVAMNVHCGNCGQELLGAVNRCWRCGQEFMPASESNEARRVRTASGACLPEPPLEAEVLNEDAPQDPAAEAARISLRRRLLDRFSKDPAASVWTMAELPETRGFAAASGSALPWPRPLPFSWGS